MREFPSLEVLSQQFKKKDLMVLAVNIAEPAGQVKEYLVKHKLTFSALLDNDSRVSDLYRVRGTPSRFLIDREGRLIAGSIGPRDWASAAARNLISYLLGLAKKPPRG
ncbi:MAG: TlpA family protein disulfide reductase [candidate division NC10 bacterium]|nr:TlpA family protein disulfide reductase [candidate division NC10 bacterium]